MNKRIICDLCANEFSIAAVDIKEEDIRIDVYSFIYSFIL